MPPRGGSSEVERRPEESSAGGSIPSRPDPYLTDCVLHEHRPAIECCIYTTGHREGGVERDFCAECIADGHDDDNFGRCYQCRDSLHHLCIGVPCQCPCPTPDQVALERLRNQALAKLTWEERSALGYA